MIERKKYYDDISGFIDKPIIKVITGIRRSGKSTFLRMLQEHLLEIGVEKEQILYMNFESFKFIDIRNSRDLYKYVMDNIDISRKVYLFFDEIQIVEDWEAAVNSFLVDFETDIYVTGSNSNMLSSEISTLLTGRYVRLKMQSLVFTEFLKFQENKIDEEDINKLLWIYIRRGGFPSIHALPYEEIDAFTLVRDIYDSIILRDAVERFNLKNIELLNRILRFVMDNIGSTFSAKKIADYFKSQNRPVNQTSVYNYLNALESTFLISRVNRFDLHGKEILKTQEKFYLSDQGILHAVLGYNDRNIPGILENIVFNELQYRGYEVHIGKLKDKEVDFVASKGNKQVYLQVTCKMELEKTIERDFGPLLAISDHHSKYVLSMDENFEDNIKGIQHMAVSRFLTTDDWEK
ncbi:ATP-binding protein [Acidaminobacter sp. JC074]|uniref:ATP-binding protein n=1 Tax=Acidaminobacter sp. JC074 TaxID=2530199 RepID=UPI001F0F88A5|nr:ATP-binding protein [Acidaminobacter sp. JC074]MCH4890631.1 ATP-binding protein [Acidaminobacter sp. JC074]